MKGAFAWCAILGLVLFAGCGSANKVNTARTDPLAPNTLYPLKVGAVWSYDVDTGVGLNTLAISRVLSVRGQRVEVGSGGAPIAYEVSSTGIRRPGEQTWVLKVPIKPGARWRSPVGEAQVLSVDAKIETLAGTFAHCVHVVEHSEDRARRVETIYCPNVGPVYIDSHMKLKIAASQTRVTARLLGYKIEP